MSLIVFYLSLAGDAVSRSRTTSLMMTPALKRQERRQLLRPSPPVQCRSEMRECPAHWLFSLQCIGAVTDVRFNSLPLPGPCRAEKGKSATKKAFQQPIVISSDEEEDEDDEDDDDEDEDEDADEHEATPVAKPKQGGARRWV